MSRYIELHPVNPQARLVEKVVDTLRDGGLVAYPTDSGYALACAPGNKEGLDRIRTHLIKIVVLDAFIEILSDQDIYH